MNGLTATQFRDMRENMEPEDLKVFFLEQCLYKVILKDR